MATSKKTESKSAIFKRLATSRMNKAIAAIDSIGKLSNPATYDYNKGQVAAITQALDAAVAATADRFANPGASTGGGFSFK